MISMFYCTKFHCHKYITNQVPKCIQFCWEGWNYLSSYDSKQVSSIFWIFLISPNLDGILSNQNERMSNASLQLLRKILILLRLPKRFRRCIKYGYSLSQRVHSKPNFYHLNCFINFYSFEYLFLCLIVLIHVSILFGLFLLLDYLKLSFLLLYDHFFHILSLYCLYFHLKIN